jgi:hypothetical protein
MERTALSLSEGAPFYGPRAPFQGPGPVAGNRAACHASTNAWIPHALITDCIRCGKEGDLFVCSTCKVVQYCGQECQAAHHSAHETYCSRIEQAHLAIHLARRKLLLAQGERVIERFKGRFRAFETEDYLRARWGLIYSLIKISTLQAAQNALGHMLDMLWLVGRDDGGSPILQEMVPILLLRLGRDQECYGGTINIPL